MRRSITFVFLLPWMCACGGEALEDPRQPTGSQTIAASSDYSALYVANTQEGTVTRLPVGGSPTSLALGGEPSRVARAGRTVFVSLRAERAVAVLEDDGATLHEIDRIPVGHEPIGVVADEAGARVYVASSLSNSIQEIDAVTFEVLREFQVSDEPRWLALHPGRTLYAATAWGGHIFSIDLETGRVQDNQLPRPLGLTFRPGLEDGGLSVRITGDIAVTPNGEQLLIPTIYNDTATPISEPEPGDERDSVDTPSGYGGSGRFNPSVTVVSLDDEQPDLEEATIVSIPTFNKFGQSIGGYPVSVTATPDGSMALATLEGTGGIAGFAIDGDDGENGEQADAGPFNDGVFAFRSILAFKALPGVRGIAFVGENRAAAYGFLARAVMEFSVDPDAWNQDNDVDRVVQIERSTIRVAESNLAPEIELGRELFYAADDQRMSVVNSNLSCATCHFDGRSDGLSWTFERGARQTPSLAGKISLTAPVRWEGDAVSVAADAMRTSQGLMGGQGLTERETDAIAAFIDSSRDVDSPLKGEADQRIARGEAIFNRPEVGCAGCHNGARYTDNQLYSMFGLAKVKTRSLVGIAGSPPYLHDGSAATLEDVLDRGRRGAMGNTSMLSELEVQDLAAFLRSL